MSARQPSHLPPGPPPFPPNPDPPADADARIAAACDDGCARIFIAQSGTPGLTYSRSLPRVEGRTLAVAWHPSGKVLATAGTDGCIHLWSLDTCHELLRITTGDGSGAASSQQACIWTLLVLRDGTVVSGDSSGNVQFWDGRFGTLLAGFAVHQADVLQLAGSPDGNMVFAAGVCARLCVCVSVFGKIGECMPKAVSFSCFCCHAMHAIAVSQQAHRSHTLQRLAAAFSVDCTAHTSPPRLPPHWFMPQPSLPVPAPSLPPAPFCLLLTCSPLAGVDPQVALFHRLPAPSSSSRKHVPWAYLSSKRPHTHDVRAMCIAQGKALPQGPRLFTGSNDSQLFNHSVDRYLKVSSTASPPCLILRL